MRQQSNDVSEGMTFAGGVQWLIIGLVGYAACFWPFTRHRFGTHSPGIAGLAAVGVMWGYVLLVPESTPAMAMFAGCWLFLVILHRAEALRNGRNRHSRHDGTPWLANLLRPQNDFMAKTGYEAAILLLAGTLLTGLSPGLGLFVMCGGVPLVVKGVVEKAMYERRMMRWRDIDIEMQSQAEDYRERYRNRR